MALQAVHPDQQRPLVISILEDVAAGTQYQSSAAPLLLILFTALISAALAAVLVSFFFIKHAHISARPAPDNAPINPPAPNAPILPPAATDRNWSPDQGSVLRAALLSRIVYFDAKRAEEELQRYGKLFGFMFVRLQGEVSENVHKMVVAMDHNSTLYFCFRGTNGIADLITDGLVRQVRFRSADLGALDSAIVGSYHQGFLACLEEKVLSMRLLSDLVRSRSVDYNARRVVFCGHSLGGALAHLALIKYMLANASSIGYDAEVAAIAFAAPHVCDKEARKYLRDHGLNIEKKLYNFVADRDPVPFLLNSLPYAREVLSRATREEGPSWIADTMIYKLCDGLDPQFQRSLHWLATNAVSIACESFTNQQVIIHIGKLIKAILDGNVQQKARNSPHCKWYVPIGNWFTHDRRLGTDEAGDMVDELHNAELARHSMAQYFDDMCHGRWHFSEEIPASNSTNNVEGEHQQIIRTVAPKIFSAVWYAEEKKVTVLGDDLELIVQARVDGEVWEHELLLDRPGEIQLTPPASVANENLQCTTQNHKEVHLVTCFGDARRPIRTQYAPVSVTWPNSRVADAYQRCSLKLGLVMQALSDKDRKFEEEKRLIRLRTDYVLPSTLDQKLSVLVSQIWPPVIDGVLRESVFTGIVIDIPTTIGITDDIGTYAGRTAAYGGGIGGVAGGLGFAVGAAMEAGIALSGVPVMALLGAATVGLPVAAIGAAGGAGFCMVRNLIYRQSPRPSPVVEADGTCTHQKAVHNYMDVLHLTSLVLGLKIPRPATNDEISLLERKIGEAFRKGRRRHVDLRDSMRRDPPINDASNKRARVISAAEYGGRGATITRESVAECVDRAEFIHDVLHADDRLSTKVKVVLVVGPQNAGKSSLINCILGRKAAETGYYRVHTGDLKCYHGGKAVRGNGEVVLVDSPGIDSDDRLAEVKGVWQNMEGVPDLVIMVMLFEGDTNESGQELPRAVAKWTKCRNQILVLNKCDQILSDSSSLSELNPQAMTEIRRNFARRANDLQPEDVIMTVLRESVVSPQPNHTAKALQARGVLLLQDARRHLLDRIESLNGYNEHESIPFGW